MLQHVVRDFRILDETDDYIVVDKPPFLLTHPTKPDQRTTLWKELRELLAFEIENGGGRAAVRIAHARASFAQRISRDCLGLAGMGNKNCRCSSGSTGQASSVSDLAEANDSSRWSARADRVSSGKAFQKAWHP